MNSNETNDDETTFDNATHAVHCRIAGCAHPAVHESGTQGWCAMCRAVAFRPDQEFRIDGHRGWIFGSDRVGALSATLKMGDLLFCATLTESDMRSFLDLSDGLKQRGIGLRFDTFGNGQWFWRVVAGF